MNTLFPGSRADFTNGPNLTIIGGLVCLDLRECTISNLISSALPIPSLFLI